MTALHQQQCEVCREGVPQVTGDELEQYLGEIPGWETTNREGIMMLQKEFTFKNWAEAQVFVNKVGDLAEENDHHPEIVLEWGKARVTWWTHTISGLHKNDFILAARTDKLS